MSILETIKSWFGGTGPEHEPEAPELEARPAPRLGVAPPSKSPPAVIDFTAVLAAAGIAPEVRERVSKAKSLLRALPSGTPSETKRQIVEAAFHAFEIPTQKIIEGASAEIDALKRYVRTGEAETATRIADGERRIAELEKEIAAAREANESAVAAQERRARLTGEEIATVEPIVQFFIHEEIARVSASVRPPQVLSDEDEVPLADLPSAPPPPPARTASAPAIAK